MGSAVYRDGEVKATLTDRSNQTQTIVGYAVRTGENANY